MGPMIQWSKPKTAVMIALLWTDHAKKVVLMGFQNPRIWIVFGVETVGYQISDLDHQNKDPTYVYWAGHWWVWNLKVWMNQQPASGI